MFEPLVERWGIRRTANAESLCSFSYLLKLVFILVLPLSCLLIKYFDFVMCFPSDKCLAFSGALTSTGGMSENQKSAEVTAVSQRVNISPLVSG